MVLRDSVKTDGSNDIDSENFPEIRLRAVAVSRGVASGKVIFLYGSNRQFFHLSISDQEIPAEIMRFRDAIHKASRQLRRITTSRSTQNHSLNDIFDTHRMMLEEPSFQSKIEGHISNSRMNAEWAVRLVGESYVAQYKTIEDEHLREKYIDIEDVVERILNALGGSQDLVHLAADSVIAAEELRPSTLVEIAGSRPRALITEHGGWTSHTFILARELNIPAVTGVSNIIHRLQDGDAVVVNGNMGEVILHPHETTLSAIAQPKAEPTFRVERQPHGIGPLRTFDGREVTIRANLDIPSDYSRAKKLGATGIGLYRSEFLFNQFKGYPNENQQTKAYRRIMKAAGQDTVKLRTFDLGIDQLVDRPISREPNPELGLRAIRLSLSDPKQLRIQLRAMLRASMEGRLDIVIPMVSGVTELREVKRLINLERRYLLLKGVAVGEPRLGAMIEVPSAVLLIDEILDECDFVCLGTNDLVQYLTAVDRDNENVAKWFRTLHPSVIRALQIVLNAGNHVKKDVIGCGEMAGSPFYVPILIGLGMVDLSMNVNSIPRVRKVIAGINYSDTLDLVHKVETCKTADAIEAVLLDTIHRKWSHLFQSEIIDTRKS